MRSNKVMICIPFMGGMTAQFHLSVTNLAYTLSKRGNVVDINYEEGSLLHVQRNRLSRKALIEGYDLMFIDSDMVFEVKDAIRVIESDKDLIGGLYFSRRKPYYPLVYGDDLVDTEYVFRSIDESKIPNEPFKCKGMGAGFLSIKHNILEKVWSNESDRPFNFIALPNGDQLGEDLSFFRRCNLMGIDIWCEPRVDVGHMSTKIITRFEHKLYKDMDFHYCNDIVGWMRVKEQNWLYDRAKEMDTVVEIGSWKGKSTHALCCAAKQVTAIDHFLGTEEEEGRGEVYGGAFKEVAEGADIYKVFRKNTRMFNNLRVLRMSSDEAFKQYGKSLAADMIFIDGEHETDQLLLDLENYEPLAKKLICGHDYTNMPSVQIAISKYFKKDVNTYDSIWYVEK